jgi:hypothetical protein
MADKRAMPEAPQQPPQDAQDKPRRSKRAAPTIDLTATEVPPDPSPSRMPPEQPASAATTAEAEARAAPALNTSIVRLGVAAGAGAAVAMLLLFGLWFGGFIPANTGNGSDLRAEVAALEKQVSDLQNQKQTPNSDTISALAGRVDKIEATLAKLPPSDASVAAKLTAADNAMKSLGLALTALSHRTDDAAGNAADARRAADAAAKAVADLKTSMQAATASNSPSVPRADIEALEKRVTTLETQAKAAHEAISKNSGTDNAARLALSAEVLRSAVAVGAPYADELAAVKPLGGDDKTLAPLAPFAASGIPDKKILANELTALKPQMLKIAGAPPPSAGFLERLQANADRLVRVRPMNAPQGDDPSALLARLDVDAANADIAGALDDLAKLPAKIRAPAKAWIEKAKARQAAIAAATEYAAVAARALRPQ